MTRRTILTLPLVPLMGRRFQPTGFPHLGPAAFPRPDGEREVSCLHVESPQSMANRLELTTWNTPQQRPVRALAAIPYVEVVDCDGAFLTSSRLEPHRLASAYVIDAQLDGDSVEDVFERKLGLVAGKPMDVRGVARAIFDLDPLSLVHGVFFPRRKWPVQPRITRAVSSFIDADDVRVAASGGVKSDSVYPRNGDGRTATSGYGMIPYSRTEYTAREITAYVTIDHELLRCYGLGEARTELLEAVIWYELAHFFSDEGMRLRTACDLRVADMSKLTKTPDGAKDRLAAAVDALGGDLAPVTTVIWSGPKSRK